MDLKVFSTDIAWHDMLGVETFVVEFAECQFHCFFSQEEEVSTSDLRFMNGHVVKTSPLATQRENMNVIKEL